MGCRFWCQSRTNCTSTNFEEELEDTRTLNQGSFATASGELEAYNKDVKTDASFLLKMIFDSHLYYVKPVRSDLIAFWKRLSEKFERKIEMLAEVAQM